MVALLEEYNPRPAKTDLSPKKCSTANFLETSNRVGNLLSSAQGLCLEKEGCAYETAPGHLDGPFGELVSQSGSYASENIYRFSTKPIDIETGYYYYGYRYYDSANGRFLNRDPIEEDGGINVYSFVLNGTLNRIDLYGLSTKRNCQSLNKEVTIDIKSGSLGTRVGLGISISGGVAIELSLGGEKCEECCGDGKWKEVTRATWTVSAKGSVGVKGGLHSNLTWGGHGVEGFLGVSGSLSASGSGSVNVTEDNCSGRKEGSGSVQFTVGGSISGGGNLTLKATKWFAFDLVRADLTGSASRSYGADLTCDGDGCTVGSISPQGKWGKSLTAKGCLFGTCYTHQF